MIMIIVRLALFFVFFFVFKFSFFLILFVYFREEWQPMHAYFFSLWKGEMIVKCERFYFNLAF